MVRKPKTIGFWCGRLPHWEVEDGRYFVTIHLAGAIPAQGRAKLRQLISQLPKTHLLDDPKQLRVQRKIFAELDQWLDRSAWNAHLQNKEIAEMVIEAIDRRTQQGIWNMFEYVVMPTHVHLFCEVGDSGLKSALEDFKRWTARRALGLLDQRGDRFWQREWFDHWSRSDEEDERITAYIRNNPVKAGLVQHILDWPYGSW
jgi:REP element-mobilizing transposase RayT